MFKLHYFSVREAAESLNLAVMELIEEVDDNPTPAQTPSQESSQESTPGEMIPAREVIFTAKGEVTSTRNGKPLTEAGISDK